LTRTKVYIAIFGYDNSGKKTFYKKVSEKKIFIFNKKKYEIIMIIFSYNKDNSYNIVQKFDFFLILYDIGDINSFNAIENILKINEISIKTNKYVIIIANKSDLYDKSKYILPDDICRIKGYKSYIVSTKTDQNFYINILNSMFEIFGAYNY
jgi:signal recognition particle receptor subunit beta